MNAVRGAVMKGRARDWSLAHPSADSSSSVGPRDIDEAAIRVRVHQSNAHAIADVQPLEPTLQAPLDRRRPDPDPRTLWRGAGDNRVEFAADLRRQPQG